MDTFPLDIYRNISEKNLKDIPLTLEKWDIIFFSWDLWAGKSTLIRALLRKYFEDDNLVVRSPTYTYYQKYSQEKKIPIFHFDLYRLESLSDLYLIWAEEHLSDETNICLIEWPEILWDTIIPTKKISITLEDDGTRRIEITTRRVWATE